MLVEFSVSNFRSIRERQTLSLVADSGKELRDTHVVERGAPATPDLVRSAVIYGANAAGKSNLILALQFMKGFVLDSARESRAGDPIDVKPFRLDDHSNGAPSEFEVVFVHDGVRYQYGFEINRTEVLAERLIAYPEGRAQRWFERGREEEPWHFGPSFKGARGLWADATRRNALFLSTAVQLNARQLQPVYDWFRDQLRVISLADIGEAFSVSQCEKDPAERARIAHFLKVADIAIAGVDVQRQKVNEATLPEYMPEAVRKSLLEEGWPVTRMLHSKPDGTQVPFDLDDESHGTRKLFALAGPWLDVLAHGRVLLIDELDTSLHPRLMRHIVGVFHNPEINRQRAQLIFTTHDTTMLDPDAFRRDQIWFVEKDTNAQSRLYPLTDFSPRKGENFERGYLQGRYGAVPFVGEWRM